MENLADKDGGDLIASPKRGKRYFVSCYYISSYKEDENSLFPMAVIAKTKDI